MSSQTPAPLPFSVAIMAGGQSRRMGTDKAFVPLLGRPMIEHVLARVANLGQAETFIVTNTPDHYRSFGLPLYTDVIPGAGSLGGIYSALSHAQTPHALVIACDLPLASSALICLLLAHAADSNGPYDAVVPRFEGTPQGLHALYAQSARDAIARFIAEKRYRIWELLQEVRTRYVDEPEYAHIDPDGRTFRNVNTPEDLAAVERLLREE